MQMMQLICPQCRANLSVDKDMKQAFCMYCGNKIIISNENEHIYRNVDEARLKEAENERLRIEFEIEQEKKREAEKNARKEVERKRKTLIISGGSLAFVGLFIVLPLSSAMSTLASMQFVFISSLLLFFAGAIMALVGFFYGMLNG